MKHTDEPDLFRERNAFPEPQRDNGNGSRGCCGGKS